MANGLEVGGDGSVAWKVQVGYARKSEIYSKQDGYRLTQGGVDETEDGKTFTVAIRIPRENAEAFCRSIAAAAKDAEAHIGDPTYHVKFELPIEPETYNQIQVHWESKEAPKGKPSLLATLRNKLTGKKSAKKKASKKAAKPAKKAAKKAGKKAGKKKR